MMRISILLWLLSASVMTCAYAQQDQLSVILQRGELIVGTWYESGHFQRIQGTQRGLEVDLSEAFARSLGVKLKIVPFINRGDLLGALRRRKIDIAAAPNLLLGDNTSEFKIGPIYSEVSVTLISPNSVYPPTEISQLTQPIVVSEKSNFGLILEKLSSTYSQLIWTALPNYNAYDIATSVQEGRYTHGIVSTAHVKRLQDFFPTLTYTPLNIDPIPVSWLLNGQVNDSLAAASLEFFSVAQQTGLVTESKARNQINATIKPIFSSQSFVKDYQNRLPLYAQWFKTYSQDIDWTILAAISYELSKWQETKNAPSEPQSLMGLTSSSINSKKDKDTERHASFSAEQDIQAGAKRLDALYEQLPLRIQQPDRVWFAVAAYFLGVEHIERARMLTMKTGDNPDMWIEVKSNLVKLESLSAGNADNLGYAPGLDARQFVENVRKYSDILVYLEQKSLDSF